MGILVSWALLAAAVGITSWVLPGFKVRGFVGALIVAAIFGALNWALGWLLFVMIGLGTLGLGFLFAVVTRWIVDAIFLRITAALSSRLEIKSFGWALAGALVMSLIGTAAEYLWASYRSVPEIYV